MTRHLRILLLSVTVAALGQDFKWNGKLNPGQVIEIKGVNGNVSADASRSNQVEVTATKEARRSNPAEVKVEVVPHEGGVTICAVYPSRAGREPNECRPGDAGRMNTQDNDVKVHFIVRVPTGVNFIGRTVNGEVRATSLGGDAEARTVNGDVIIDTAGFAQGKTVNGSISASMRKPGTRPVTFETVNGAVTLAVPKGTAADFEARTVNGTIKSDLPLTLQGSIDRRRLAGTLNGGGPKLAVKTVNGSIHLKSLP